MIKPLWGVWISLGDCKKPKTCLEKKIPRLQPPVPSPEEFIGLQFLMGPKFNVNDTFSVSFKGLLYVFKCSRYVCAPCVHLCQQRPAVGTGTPGTEIVVGFKPPGGYWESDLGFVQEQVPDPSQPPFHSFCGLFPSCICVCGHTCMYSCAWMFMPMETWSWHQMSSRFLPVLFILFNMSF